MRISLVLLLLFCGVLSLAFTNCSQVGFNKPSGSSSNSSLSDEDAYGHLLQPGSGGGPNDPAASSGTPASTLPKVQLISPPCEHLTLCEVEFRLDKAYPAVTEYNWRTNDTLYQTPHNPLYGQPNVHYQPTSGHVVFQAGEISKKVYVQNINPNDYQVIIGVLMSACQYNSQYESCLKFFPNL